MKFTTVSATFALLSTSVLALVAPPAARAVTTTRLQTTATASPRVPPVVPAAAPPAGAKVFKATAGYNATHGLPYDKSPRVPTTKRDLVARQSYSGQATWFYPGLGACGGENSEYEYVVALDAPLWEDGANCWRGITIQAYGQQVNAAIVDLGWKVPRL
ncbi:hypothetical protein CTheo_9181 [Ceratobasidium theobromae]|uniref:Effector protein n=1 Tax=Ceratobasidium theobromae TaxID=1582974 RepID=A0A5N5Q7B5_9AGAM|nr:hypothetical protein CTheo_9181 [Ceratobasidium theobromae]